MDAAAFAPAMPTPEITRSIVATTRFSYGELPDEVIVLAKQCLLDWVGVAIVGAREPLVEMLVAEAGSCSTNAPSVLLGRTERTAPAEAALINGAAGHALDYDDVNIAMNGHPSAPVAPAIFALAGQSRLAGRDVITAFVTGYEAACRIGQLLQPGHYARGFHVTSTVGTLAAALGCGALLGLDVAASELALSIAASSAGGLNANFGTMCKPLHAGRAAASGLSAARLAMRGFTAQPAILERQFGFAAAFGDGIALPGLAEPSDGFHIRDNLFKYHAACYGVHAAIEAVRKLCGQGVTPEQIVAIELAVSPRADGICNIQEPRSGLEAKFSLRLAAALALAGADTADPTLYSAAAAMDPYFVELRDKIFVTVSPARTINSCELTAELTDGRRLVTVHDSNVPLTDLTLQAALLNAKFDALAGPVLGHDRAQALRNGITALEDFNDSGELIQMCRLT